MNDHCFCQLKFYIRKCYVRHMLELLIVAHHILFFSLLFNNLIAKDLIGRVQITLLV